MQQVIGYVRVSTQGQVDDGVSLDAQRAKIAAWCALNDARLVDVFEDRGLSGKSRDGREGLRAALAAATKGSALVTYSISRLARSTRDMLDIAEQLDAAGVDLVSLTERIDTTTASGRMIFKMLAVLSDFERDQLGERTKLALRHKRAVGEVYSGPVFGFDAVEGRLVAVAQESRVVGEILAAREAGVSYAAIADRLNARGVVGKRGGRWFASTVSYVARRQQASA